MNINSCLLIKYKIFSIGLYLDISKIKYKFNLFYFPDINLNKDNNPLKKPLNGDGI